MTNVIPLPCPRAGFVFQSSAPSPTPRSNGFHADVSQQHISNAIERTASEPKIVGRQHD